jgi:adenosylcobinamide hydrolase
MRPSNTALVVELGGERRCLSSAVLGGGLRIATHWLNLQVERGYPRLDPDVHLAEEAILRGLDAAEVIGMLTAADVDAVESHQSGAAHTRATVGISHPLAAAGRLPRRVVQARPVGGVERAGPEARAGRMGRLGRVGTINLLVVVDAPLSDAALVGAIQTATEAKAQALADAGVTAANHHGAATGTATDSICIAALPGATEPFAGPVTPVGAAIATSVHAAVLAGARAHRSGVARTEGTR